MDQTVKLESYHVPLNRHEPVKRRTVEGAAKAAIEVMNLDGGDVTLWVRFSLYSAERWSDYTVVRSSERLIHHEIELPEPGQYEIEVVRKSSNEGHVALSAICSFLPDEKFVAAMLFPLGGPTVEVRVSGDDRELLRTLIGAVRDILDQKDAIEIGVPTVVGKRRVDIDVGDILASPEGRAAMQRIYGVKPRAQGH